MVEKTPLSAYDRKKPKPMEADAVVLMMNKAMDVARLQFKRVKKDLDNFKQISGEGASVAVFDGSSGAENMSASREARTALFADIHFLLISLHETEQHLSRLKKLFPLETDLSNLHNRYRSVMRKCAEFKTHMEHVDGKESGDLGNLVDTLYTLRGKGIDLGPDFEKKMEALFCDLMSVWSHILERQKRIRELMGREHPAS